MTKTESYLDFLRANLADVFRRFLFVKHSQACTPRLSSANKDIPVKKARINMAKYGYLFNTVGSEGITNNLQLNENKFRKNERRVKNKSKKKTQRQQPSKIIIIPPSPSLTQNATSQSSISSKIDDYQPSEIPAHCRKQMNFLYNMQPTINVHSQHASDPLRLLDCLKHQQTKETSVRFQAEQLFRCPKDPRSRRRKCCGGSRQTLPI